MVLRFLTDENISFSLVISLRKNGYDVKDIKEENLFGIEDKEVLDLAFKDGRTVITHDKDFANLLSYSFAKHKGVILLRFLNQSPKNVNSRFIPIIKEISENKIVNSLVIVGDDYVKIT